MDQSILKNNKKLHYGKCKYSQTFTHDHLRIVTTIQQRPPQTSPSNICTNPTSEQLSLINCDQRLPKCCLPITTTITNLFLSWCVQKPFKTVFVIFNLKLGFCTMVKLIKKSKPLLFKEGFNLKISVQK